MDANKEFVSRKQEYQVILDDLNRCCLCGTKLIFTHKIDYMHMTVHEEATCPSCKVKLKSQDFGLQ